MRLVFRKLSCIIAAALVIGCLSGVSGKAEAGLIPYSVIGVNEFNLPVKYEPFNAFLSYNVYRDEGKSWEGESGARDTFLSVEKYARFFKIDALPSVGFLWEAVVGGIYTSGKDDTSTTGILDMQTGFLAWVRPTPNLTTGLEYFLYLPFGTKDVSSHTWANSIAFCTNYNLAGFTLDGDIGYKFVGDTHADGKHSENGDVFFGNLVLAYQFMKNIQPMLKLDFQATGSGKDKATGMKTSGSEELAGGIGNHFTLTEKLSGDIWYEHGLTGRNTTKTNSVLARIVYVF